MKITEFIEISYWNMHLKFEAIRRIKKKWWKMLSAPDLRNKMTFTLFLKVHQNSWNLQNLLESASELCIWNSETLKSLKKNAVSAGLKK